MAELDLLQIKIEKARAALPEETRAAIDAVNWRQALLDIRADRGFNLDQLESLELETELMLVGLINPEDYQKEIQSRMGITAGETTEIVNMMNEKVFKKIREEFAKILAVNSSSPAKGRRADEIETGGVNIKGVTPLRPDQNRGTPPSQGEISQDSSILKSAGIEIMPEELESKEKSAPSSDSTTETILENREEMLQDVEHPEIIKSAPAKTSISESKFAGTFKIEPQKTEYVMPNMGNKKSEVGAKLPKVDPYREQPE